jgi:signal transduction histidine kinase
MTDHPVQGIPDESRDFGDLAGVLSLLDSTAALRQVAAVVPHRIDADVGVAAGRVDEDDTVEVIAAPGAPDLVGLRVPPALGLGGQATVLRHPVAVIDYCSSMQISHDFDEPVRAASLRAVLAVPILRGHRLYGVLYAGRRTATPWSDHDRHALLDLGRHAALILEVAASAREMADVAVYSERQRWAVEMHDTVGALLFSLRAALIRLSDAPDMPGHLASDVSTVERLAEQISTAVRGQLRSLHSAPSDKALAVALRADCRELFNRSGIRAEVVILGDLAPLDASRSDALVRAGREALLNVEKHANANSVVVSLFSTDGGVGVAVADDGTGTGCGQCGEPGGLGLGAAAERVERVGGWLTFSAGDDGGGMMRAWVPAATESRTVER